MGINSYFWRLLIKLPSFFFTANEKYGETSGALFKRLGKVEYNCLFLSDQSVQIHNSIDRQAFFDAI